MNRIFLWGDLALNGLIERQSNQNPDRFAEVKKLFKPGDISICNLETPIFVDGFANPSKNIHFSTNTNVATEILKMLSVKVVSLANNHIYDYQMEGVRLTIKMLESMNIGFTGAGWLPCHTEPYIFNHCNNKYAFIACVDKFTNPGTDNVKDLRINYLDPDKIVKEISRLRTSVDKILVSIHWGVDFSNYFTMRQKEIAQKFVRAGADLIFGHHPHTLQPWENYDGKNIFYSLGGMTFGDDIWKGEMRATRRQSKIGLILRFAHDLDDLSLIYTKELIGNKVRVFPYGILRMSFFHQLNRLALKFPAVYSVLRFYETTLPRVYEYFFGYYRKPLLQILKLLRFTEVRHLVQKWRGDS